MRISVCRAKIHRARVTGASVDYEGSLTIDEELMERVGIYPYEKILVANINNGNRFETYVIKGERGKRQICLNGATAKLGRIGDIIIILNFGQLEESEINQFKPKYITLDHDNNIIKKNF
ncbi:aspartate 1-decarboxylase [Candidatus Auribacterota bacterium]